MRGRLAGAAAILALMLVPASGVGAVDDHIADVCLEVDAEHIDEASWSALRSAMEGVAADHPELFPVPVFDEGSNTADGEAATFRLLIAAGHTGEPTRHEQAGCLADGHHWGARFGRGFLGSGADEMLAQAPTTPGIDSHVDIEWSPAEERMLTRLEFAGPLDIPNGTCWIDETLGVDTAAGTAIVTGERGVKTSPFAEGACRRFFEFLPDGGAGGQAAALLPEEVPLMSGEALRLRVSDVDVTDAGVSLGGSVEVR